VLLLGYTAHADTIPPTDANILYTGRWDMSTPSQPWAQAKGSSIIANFQGTSIGVTVSQTHAGEYIRIIIDDDAAGSTKFPAPRNSQFFLTSGLTDAVHKIEVIKETDAGRMTFIGFELDSGKTLAPPPARPPRRIVFYGDSNLAGYSLESERNLSGNNLTGSYYTYAGITSRMFDAEYHNISLSGATIGSLHTSYDRISWNSATPLWNFSLFEADVVVVNIGANDVGRPKAHIKSDYDDLLDDLRVSHPTSHIMLYNAYGWDFDETANYIDEVIEGRSDPDMSYAVFPWLFEQFHGCETDHAGMAQYLAAHLTTVMGWTPGPTDVVSGYGMNGNVANGSFEEVAPFGGWGWRYFDLPKTSRVHDPAGAHHGEYYLRLTDSVKSHQSNPASDGDPVTVTAWMRGESDGDEVSISIDFRNQDQGAEPNTPMQIETEVKTLSTEWQQYTMTSTAPTNGPNPVFSNRVTFEAAAGDAVHIDHVVTFVPEPAVWLQLLAGTGGLLLLCRYRGQSPRFAANSGRRLSSPTSA
jgi:lysophospholipase L1-like esterase